MSGKATESSQMQANARDGMLEEIASPAILTPLHTQDRVISKVAGAPRAWRKITEIQAAYGQGRLGARRSTIALRRLSAACVFTKIYDCSQKAGRDCTQPFVSGGTGQREAFTLAQQAAITRLVATERHLGERDRMIVRAVCCWGHSPVEAMALAKLPKETRVTARLCEALDALADALERTEKRGR